MNKKIIVLSGPPWSWKSTRAKEFIKENPKSVRFNKDDIREQLGITSFSKSKEKEVIEIERSSVKFHMQGWVSNIVVDNTHIGKYNPHIKFYRELAEKYWYEFELKVFDTPYEECIARDALRWDKKVWWEVIKKFQKQLEGELHPKHPTFKERDDELETAIIVDIDWTLAFSPHRSPYDYSKVQDDKCNDRLSTLLDVMLDDGRIKLIVVSWRDDNCLEISNNWMKNNWLYADEIYFRETWDKRKDSIVKEEIYNNHIRWRYNVLAVFDDRNQVVDMWRGLGLPTYQVWYWDF